jgi:hypothetical protein
MAEVQQASFSKQVGFAQFVHSNMYSFFVRVCLTDFFILPALTLPIDVGTYKCKEPSEKNTSNLVANFFNFKILKIIIGTLLRTCQYTA